METTKTPLFRRKGIRIAAQFLSSFAKLIVYSVVPSLVCVFLVFVSPNTKMWHIMKFAAFFIFLGLNWFSWMRCKTRIDGVKRFYLVNGGKKRCK